MLMKKLTMLIMIAPKKALQNPSMLKWMESNFPREAVASLAERISGEIREPEKRVRFQQTMLQMLRGSQQAA